jgi:hypothetical protein
MGCQHLEDDYELYLLGAIPDGESADLEMHLHDRCPACREGLREAAESVYWLLQSAAPVRPRPAVKSRLRARLALGLDGADLPDARPAREPVRGTGRRSARKR